MEEEIKEFTRANGKPYRLIPLPMADKVEWEGERLPATYANFLIMNGAVLVPFYDSPKDEIAKAALREAFPDREIVGTIAFAYQATRFPALRNDAVSGKLYRITTTTN